MLLIISLIFSIITFLIVGFLAGLAIQGIDGSSRFNLQENLQATIIALISALYILVLLHSGGYLGRYFRNKVRK
ncbi:MAG: hypothetical protein V1808_00840 [Candidatus Daviesbacteria bacterium]